jgi:hypothetical protein
MSGGGPLPSPEQIVLHCEFGLTNPVEVEVRCGPKAIGTAQGITDHLAGLVSQIPDIDLFSLQSITFLDVDELQKGGSLPAGLIARQRCETVPAPVVATLDEGELRTQLFLDDRLFTSAYESRSEQLLHLANGIFAYKLAQLVDIQQRWTLTPELICLPDELEEITGDALSARLCLLANALWSNYFAAKLAATTYEAMIRPYAVLFRTEMLNFARIGDENTEAAAVLDKASKLYVTMASLIGHLTALGITLGDVLPDLEAEIAEYDVAEVWERMAALLDDMDALYPEEFDNLAIFGDLGELVLEDLEQRGLLAVS